MKEFKYVITDPEGIHARPAGEFVKAAASFASDVKITKDGKTVSAKKIFGVMGLAVKKGQEITVTVEGEDEEAAAAKLEEFFPFLSLSKKKRRNFIHLDNLFKLICMKNKTNCITGIIRFLFFHFHVV